MKAVSDKDDPQEVKEGKEVIFTYDVNYEVNIPTQPSSWAFLNCIRGIPELRYFCIVMSSITSNSGLRCLLFICYSPVAHCAADICNTLHHAALMLCSAQHH